MVHDSEFISASDFIESNPDPAFSKVVRAGFALWYRTECHGGKRQVYVKATLSGNHAGKADFVESETTTDIQNIYFQTAFRRHGVGTAMCVIAEKILRKPLRNIWKDSELTKYSKALLKHLGR